MVAPKPSINDDLDDKHGLDKTTVYVPLSYHQRQFLMSLCHDYVLQAKTPVGAEASFAWRILEKLAKAKTS